TNLHGHQTFIPTFDHAARTNGKLEGLVVIIRAVKLGSVFQRSCVVHRYSLPNAWTWSGAVNDVYILKAGCCSHFGSLTAAAMLENVCNDSGGKHNHHS